MELSENKYFENVMSKYLLILIENNIYQYRKNVIFITQNSDDKALGIYNAMKDISYIGEKVICLNFDKDFSVQSDENLQFIGDRTSYYSTIPCDFLFVYSSINDRDKHNDVINYYNPKFIFYC